MRKDQPGSMQSAIRAAITLTGGLECAAADMEVSTTTLSRATDYDESRPGGLGVNYLHRLGRILPPAVVPIAQHFAHLAGGFFQPLPTAGALASDFSELTSKFAQVLSDYAEAHSDRSDDPTDYTPAEARHAIADVRILIAAAAQFAAALEHKAQADAPQDNH